MATVRTTLAESKAYLTSQLWRSALAILLSAFQYVHNDKPYISAQSRMLSNIFFSVITLLQLFKTLRAWLAIRKVSA